MPAKKTRKPADGARYLLSADRKFRRLSLKKISERVKSARRRAPARSTAKTATASQPPAPVEARLQARLAKPASADAPVALVLGGAVLFAAVVGVLWSSPLPVSATESAPVLTADLAPGAPVTSPVASPAVTASPALNASPARNASPAPAVVTSKTTSAPTETVKARTEIAPAPAAIARSSTPVEAQPEVAVQPEVAPQPEVTAASIDTVTITGCLEHDGKSAWLKNTSGVDAPRTRSWKSGFLRKRAPRIALVDGPASASSYDGHQVSVTGVLVDREMHVSMLTSIAGDCE